jgi:hypothetical protein
VFFLSKGYWCIVQLIRHAACEVEAVSIGGSGANKQIVSHDFV